jgi:hypothetical protein
MMQSCPQNTEENGNQGQQEQTPGLSFPQFYKDRLAA